VNASHALCQLSYSPTPILKNQCYGTALPLSSKRTRTKFLSFFIFPLCRRKINPRNQLPQPPTSPPTKILIEKPSEQLFSLNLSAIFPCSVLSQKADKQWLQLNFANREMLQKKAFDT